MSVFSKLLQSELSAPFNCESIIHTWTPSCTEASLDMFLITFTQTFKAYAPLYLVNQILVERKFSPYDCAKTFYKISMSSCAISYTFFLLYSFICASNKLTGKLHYIIFAILPTFAATFMANMLESNSRKGTLALYMGKIACQTMFNLMVLKGYVNQNNGQTKNHVILFTASISLMLYTIKLYGYKRDPISRFLKLLLGDDEAFVKRRTKQTLKIKSFCQDYANNNWNILKIFHYSCPNSSHDSSCFYYSFKALLNPFLIGWIGHMTISTIRRPNTIITKGINYIISDQKSLNFGLFLGTFSFLYKFSSCLFRVFTGENSPKNAFFSGLIAAPAFYFHPSSDISLYTFWHSLDALYRHGVKTNWFSYSNGAINILLSAACTFVYYNVIFNAKEVPKSFKNFADYVTNRKLNSINRLGLDIISGKIKLQNHNTLDQLSFQNAPRKFKETVLLWLIK